MNYRHAYHAGNFADVLKHAVTAWTVRYLQGKEGPLCLIDTHGGAGVYDLAAEAALKTGEAESGIRRLMGAGGVPQVFESYLDLVRAANGGGDVGRYPGSPWLMSRLLRPQDRAVVGELHPEDAAALRAALAGARRVRIVEGDGYRLLSSLVPPPEKRGLVLIDPPFEAADEFERLARAVIGAHEKWPTGVFVLWYPVKDARAVERFHAELLNAQIGKMSEIRFAVAGEGEGLTACGLTLINAPWTLGQDWTEPLQWLARALAQGDGAGASIEVLSA